MLLIWDKWFSERLKTFHLPDGGAGVFSIFTVHTRLRFSFVSFLRVRSLSGMFWFIDLKLALVDALSTHLLLKTLHTFSFLALTF